MIELYNNRVFNKRILGATVLALGSLLSPIILESAGVSYFFALRVLQGISIVKGFTDILNYNLNKLN